MRIAKTTLLALLALLGLASGTARRPVTDRPRKTQKTMAARTEQAWQRGAIRLTRANNDTLCLHLDSVRFSGFDKPSSGDKETFLLTNRNRLTLIGLSLEITYLTPDGQQIHARTLTIPCSVPPFGTRKIDVRSFDTQGAYHYIRSSAGRSGAAPFTVTFRPLTLFYRPQ